MEKELSIIIPEGRKRERADKLLAGLVDGISRSQLQRLIQAGLVWKDDEVVEQSEKLESGDQITITVPSPVPLELRPVEMDLDILFEDGDIVVLNKPSGLVVHPGAGTGEDTLVHGLLAHCSGQLSGIGGKERPGIVHRLDKETSGIIVVAKNDAAFQGMTVQFAERRLEKYYLAMLSGAPNWEEMAVDQPIGRHSVHRTRMAIRPDGRPAQSLFKIIRRDEGSSLAEVRIFTGRTHQIRVHAKHLGFPIVGDSLYGYKGKEMARFLLHAWRLIFNHPITGESLDIQCRPPFEGLGT